MKKGHHTCVAVDNLDTTGVVAGTSTLRVRRLETDTTDDDLDRYVVILYPGTPIGEVERAVQRGSADGLTQTSVRFTGRHIAQAIAEAFRK